MKRRDYDRDNEQAARLILADPRAGGLPLIWAKTFMRQSSTAWEAGYAAGAAGEPSRCPHAARSVEAWSWHSGFVESKGTKEGERYDDDEK
jgi:hypothetical protein